MNTQSFTTRPGVEIATAGGCLVTPLSVENEIPSQHPRCTVSAKLGDSPAVQIILAMHEPAQLPGGETIVFCDLSDAGVRFDVTSPA